MSWGRRLTVLAAAFGALVVGVCSAPRWLPERYAVNVPPPSLRRSAAVERVASAIRTGRIRAIPGHRVSLYAEVRGARMMRVTRAGDLLVSAPRGGRIALLRADANGDGRPDGVFDLLRDLDRPHGLDVHGEWLYVAEESAIGRVRFDAAKGAVSGAYERLRSDLPAGGRHWTKTLSVGPDGSLYVAVGSSCNVCIEEDPRRGSVLRYGADGSGGEIFASGLRNAVGLAWDPVAGALLATDNGTDLLGDDFPPCELNRVTEGGFYGWPLVDGAGVRHPEFADRPDGEVHDALPPIHEFGAHHAPLGLAVLGVDAPTPLAGSLLVALHGSWNRTQKAGYKVVSLRPTDGGGFVEEDFLWGFLEADEAIGRPVDVAPGPDGSIYVSDDYAGVVYRVTPERGGPPRS